jgi:hypothetical protein
MTDSKHCGACLNYVSKGEAALTQCWGENDLCRDGKCRPCDGGQTACDNQCVNLMNDNQNCGYCSVQVSHGKPG